jgi:hypothetical protein
MKKLGRLTFIGAALLVAAALFGPFSLLPSRAVAEIDVSASSPGAPVVVELFTSQGCSSCPPADALLGELAQLPGVVALAMHIDYWDYIGWKDPYANPELTKRQQGYAKRLAQRYVYTPQMVIDGRVHVVGSQRRKVFAAIEKAASARKALQVSFSPDNGGKIVIPAGHAPDDGATVWLAIYDGVHETDVRKGENAGQAIRNVHVVRELVDLGTWTGEAMEIPLDLSDAAAMGRAGCAVLVQQGRTGPILGATVIHIGG